MLPRASISGLSIIVSKIHFDVAIKRGSRLKFEWRRNISYQSYSPERELFTCFTHHIWHSYPTRYHVEKLLPRLLHSSILVNGPPFRRPSNVGLHSMSLERGYARDSSCGVFELKTDKDVVRFDVGDQTGGRGSSIKVKKTPRQAKMSRKKKLNELRFYRLKAKKKMNSPNPEVRIRYKLEKAKRKEEWLIEKLRKYELPKARPETYDPEILTKEERFVLKRTGERKKHYVPVGRRGVFGGVVLNMHLHWKKHETVKVVCKPCKPGQVHQYAEELARLSKGIIIDIKPNDIIIFYRGKNYVQPDVMSPTDTLSKAKALEKYQYEQSLEHTSQFIEKLESELEEYLQHCARYQKKET